MKFTEEMMKLYEAPLSETEEHKCKNAIGMVRDAMKLLGYTDDGHVIDKKYIDTLAFSVEMRSSDYSRNIQLLVQGSYANNTNVRTESDVDIAVIEESSFRTVYPSGATDNTYGFVTTQKKVGESNNPLKDQVELALIRKFGSDVQRKNKSIKINGNSYRVNSDAVPSMRHKDFKLIGSFDKTKYIGGIQILADDGQRIVNYPEQHIMNGKQKNNETNYYYKKMVRVIKKMRYLMQDNRISVASNVSSFSLESLLWNIPNSVYVKYSEYLHVYLFYQLIQYLKNNSHELVSYKEANGIKNLFESGEELGNMVIFINALDEFFEYE